MLTRWENHRTAAHFDGALIIKSCLFAFFNSYSTLFYIAFCKASDLARPRKHSHKLARSRPTTHDPFATPKPTSGELSANPLLVALKSCPSLTTSPPHEGEEDARGAGGPVRTAEEKKASKAVAKASLGFLPRAVKKPAAGGGAKPKPKPAV